MNVILVRCVDLKKQGNKITKIIGIYYCIAVVATHVVVLFEYVYTFMCTICTLLPGSMHTNFYC